MGTDLNRLGKNPGQKTLEMGKSVEDVEEGEISDSALVEEIGKKKDDSKVGLVSNNELVREIPRVWTMQDIHKYQVSRNYASGFYNIAWAQAVQNKPLNEVFNDHNNNNNNTSSSGNNDKPNDEVENGDGINKLVIDLSIGDDDDKSEKEEGELEEGEIDFNVSDSDVSKSENSFKGNKKTLEERIEVIREALESVITNDSEESFDTVCSRIKDLLDSLWEVILEDSGSNIDELVKLAFRAIHSLNIMFGSTRQYQREQNKDSLSRLFRHVTSQNPPLFSTEQIKEIEHMIMFLDSGTPSPSLENTAKLTKIEKIEEAKITMDFTKLETTSFKNRGKLLPLLDLHKDHDEDSLPSPTRDAPSAMPPSNDVAIRSSVVKPHEVAIPYFETDAINAISTYQQKFGRTSFHMSDLPSPTPSEDGDERINETGDEVSSSFGTSVETTITPNLSQSNIPSSCAMDISSSVGATTPSLPHLNVSTSSAMDISISHVVNKMTNIVPVKSSAKSRDPRLRFANKDTVVSRVSNIDSYGKTTGAKKQKPTHEPVSDEPILKRQKNGPTDIGSVVNSSSGVSNIVNVLTNGFDNLRGAGTSNRFPLDSLLKDIAMNPALYVNLFKMEQQKAVDPVKNFTHLSSSNSAIGTIPPVNVTLLKPLVVMQKPAEVLHITSQTASTDEAEKIRMKPRDPRRALHTNKVQKVGNGGSNHIITSTSISSSQETRVGLNSCNQPDRNVPPMKNLTVPDITRQFTNNIKDNADIVSVSQTPTGPPVNNQDGTISSPEEPSASPCQSQNAWGEVEHLFEGLDEKQKAAFHNERARRIDEQKKMFSARKLCLVLDLDHTLLNSAKFVEVDPAHDEILRKKEEQDREKPHRHLFRFPHMGMWTKLRPGIWNFLEKASKLFELHLYTMGNKLYATEMAKLLDPNGTLFSGRVISRGDDGDDGDISKSKDLEGVLGMESGVVIIDDSIRVWPHNKLNLIVVERYIYFPCSRRQFGLLGPSLLEIDHDERPEEGTLASSLAVIERIHQNFFAHRSLDEADVRNILASEQRRILGGCRIVFSRVFPVGESSPNLHPLWQTAEQFGAVCTNQIDDQVTHVVANSLGTDKVNWALSTGRFVVHPGWVEASALLYRRANEQDFAIKP